MLGHGAALPNTVEKRVGKDLRKRLVSRRIPLRRRVTLKFPHFGQLVSEHTTNVSMTGMFVESKILAPRGTVVSFELAIADGFPEIIGRAEVVWVRERREGSNRGRGMGLRFWRLDEASRALIRETIEDEILAEGDLLDLDELLAVDQELMKSQAAVSADPRGGEVDHRKLHPYAGSATARQTPAWTGRHALIAAVIAALLAILGAWLWFS